MSCFVAGVLLFSSMGGKFPFPFDIDVRVERPDRVHLPGACVKTRFLTVAAR
jgi:hypothetical protein